MATYNGHNEDSSGNILLSIGNGMTATVETGTTASQAYTKGSYLFFNNRLCKATSAISSGATLAIGTNLSQTSIGQEITSHLRSSDGKEFYFDVKDGTYGYYPSASKTASEFVPFGGTTGYIPKIVCCTYHEDGKTTENYSNISITTNDLVIAFAQYGSNPYSISVNTGGGDATFADVTSDYPSLSFKTYGGGVFKCISGSATNVRINHGGGYGGAGMVILTPAS